MALTRIKQNQITQPLDQDLSVPNLSANGNITATGDLTVGGNTSITGSLTVDGNVSFSSSNTAGTFTFGDGDKLQFGDSSDLQIYHDGFNSVIKEDGTGHLYIQAEDSIRLTNNNGSQVYARFNHNGSALLTHSGSPKLTTTSTGIDVTGLTDTDTLYVSSTAVIGNSGANISNAGANSLQVGNTGGSRGITIISANTGASSIYFADNQNNDAGYISYSHVDDSIIFNTGRSQTLKVSEDTNGYTVLESSTLTQIKAPYFNVYNDSPNSRSAILAQPGGATKIWYDDTIRFETTNTGIDVTGTIQVDNATIHSDLTVGGDFTVSGNTTFIDSDNLAIEDLNIVLANGAANSSVADGAGITIDGADATLTWNAADSRMVFNKDISVPHEINFVDTNNKLYVDQSAGLYMSLHLAGSEKFRFKRVSSNDVQLLPKQYSTGTTAASYPAYTFSEDENSGLGWFGTDAIQLVTGGTTRVIVDSAGRMTIGKTSTIGTQDNLEIHGGNIVNPNQTGAEITSATLGFGSNIHLEERQPNGAYSDRTDLAFVLDTGYGQGESEKFRMTAGGNFGIGTSNPTSPLHLAKDSGSTILELQRTNANSTGAVGTINFTANQGYSVASISAIADGNDNGADIVFRTTSTADTNDPYGSQTKERLTIKSQGHIDTHGNTINGIRNEGRSSSIFTAGQYYYLFTADPSYNGASAGAEFTIYRTQTLDSIKGIVSVRNAGGTTQCEVSFTQVTTGVFKIIGYRNADNYTVDFYVTSTSNSSYTPRWSVTNMLGSAYVKDTAPGDPPSETFVWYGDKVDATAIEVESTFRMRSAYDDNFTLFDGRTSGSDVTFDSSINFDAYYDNAARITLEHNDFELARRKLHLELSGSRALTIKHGGNVGIGTSTPAHTLDVAGDINAQSSFRTDEVRHSIRPTLNLDFANSKSLDPRITFYRDSIATYYDSKGTLRYANHNEPRFDHDPITKECKGLLIEESRTNDFQGGELVHVNGATNYGGYWVLNYAKAPNGKYEANALYGDGRSSTARAYWGTTGANTYTFSVYAKDNGSGRFSLWAYSGGWVYSASFTWQSDGSLTTDRTPPTYDDTVIEMVGDGWARVSATWTTPGNGSFQLSPGLYANYVENDSTLFWGGQLEIGKPFSTSFIPGNVRFESRSSIATYWDENGILKTAGSNEARYGYSKPYLTETFEINAAGTNTVLTDTYTPPSTPVKAGLIIEPQAATNLVYNSYNLANYQGAYQPGNSSWEITDEVQAPDGSYTASKFTFATDVGSVNTGFTSTIYGAYQDETWYTYSIWLKGPAGTAVGTALLADTGGNIEPMVYLTGEWQNVIIHKYYLSSQGGTYLRTHSVIQRNAPGVTATCTDGRTAPRAGYVYVWGEQIVEGIQDSSYIPTYGATATRAADVYVASSTTRAKDSGSITDNNFSNIYNQEEGSVFVNYQLGQKLAQMRVVSLSKDNSEYVEVVAGYGSSGSTTTGPYWFGPTTGSSLDASGSQLTNVANTNIKFAGRIKENDYRATSYSALEWAVGVDTDAGLARPVKLNFGDHSLTDSQMLCGHIRKIAYYPQALSDDELFALAEND